MLTGINYVYENNKKIYDATYINDKKSELLIHKEKTFMEDKINERFNSKAK
ncbi:MAG: hypothetical protein RR891_11855 [Clostridium sp.]